ncbi:membrane dipeptidase [Parafilimonas terrae]|uniref:Membrane dipeptidase n=2 Tax=Parafilimonas terrae TaxID=1465490 RepID=A0A1I5YW56_9BACT|nr:membrane dipeptidase [Parafilimonas terrae]
MKLLFFAAAFIAFIDVHAQNYKKLHFESILCDTHNDVISTCLEKGYSFDQNLTGKTHSDLNRMFKAGVDVQVFSIWCDGTQVNPYAFANREIDTLYAWVKRNPGKMMLVTNSTELMQAVKQHKLAAMIGVEGGHMIENSLSNLDNLYARGTRYLTLTWNNNNEWATSAKFETDSAQSQRKMGLTDFGKQIVQHMNKIGMMVDVSHVGEKTFWDVINTTTKPVIASHSDAYSICPVPRNLKDDQIKAIAKNGGVIQLNFYSGFLDSGFDRKEKAFEARHAAEKEALVKEGKNEFFAWNALFLKYADEVREMRAPFHLILDHLDHIVKLVGVDYVGMGSDFDGISFPPQDMDDVTAYPLITKALLERGYSKTDIEKILGGNFIRVLKANEAK